MSRPDWPNAKGALAAMSIIGGWAAVLTALLSVEMTVEYWWWIPGAVALQAFLYTGLFITAHDGMHETITPDFPRLNDLVGKMCVGLFALFSFRKLKRLHWAHHRHPATEDDPDYHDGQHDGFWRWYLRFMRGYLSVVQLVAMAVVFNLLQHVVGVAAVNLVLFWVVPSLLSTLQLFYFGTVLPHRRPKHGYADEHRARSNDFHPVVSFLTCYHFGYHWEHHERPDLPWWALPAYRAARMDREVGR